MVACAGGRRPPQAQALIPASARVRPHNTVGHRAGRNLRPCGRLGWAWPHCGAGSSCTAASALALSKGARCLAPQGRGLSVAACLCATDRTRADVAARPIRCVRPLRSGCGPLSRPSTESRRIGAAQATHPLVKGHRLFIIQATNCPELALQGPSICRCVGCTLTAAARLNVS